MKVRELLMRGSFSRTIIRFTEIFVICVLVAGCGVRVRNLPSQNLLDYKFSSSRDGLRISIDPFSDKERVEKYFGVDLLSDGILPVLVGFENIDSEDGFILVKEKSYISMDKLEDRQVRSEDNIRGYEELESALSIYNFGRIIGSPLFTFIGETQLYNESTILRNMDEKKFVDKIVYPGGLNVGFLYFKLKKKEDIGNIETVILPVQNIRNNEIKSIIVKMKML